MRVLIAEDELLERKAMIKFIEANFNDLEVIGEAPNGRKAIELAETLHPDMILMDIKMPGINGLEAIEKITQINPAIKFILVSAYDSFAYAKQAMHFGIKEYILKPGKKEEIVRAIRRVQKEIMLDRQQRQEKTQSDQVIKEHLLTKLMKYPLAADAKNMHQQFFPMMKGGYFLVIQATKEISPHAFETIIQSPFIVQHQEGQSIVCVFSLGKPDKAEILQATRSLHLELGKDSFVGAGHPSASIDEMPTSYQAAFTACYQLEKENGRHYGFFTNSDNWSENGFVTRLLEMMERGSDQEAVQLYHDYHAQVESANLEALYFHIKRIMSERGLAAPETTLSELTSKKDWEKFIMVCCLHIQAFYQSKQYIEKAKTFIQQHFQDAITLEETAAQVNLSANYFSNLFKQEFGTTFIDYVTTIRLQKAKELLEENNYSLKEISYLVGYNDPNYFSRVFKKHYAASPKHFQQEIFKK